MRQTGKTTRAVNFFVEQLIQYKICIITDEPDTPRPMIEELYGRVVRRLISEHGFNNETHFVHYEFLADLRGIKAAAILTMHKK